MEPASEQAGDAGAGLPARGDCVDNGDIVAVDGDFATTASTSSSSTSLAMTYGDPELAAGVAVFGLGLLVLPVMARLNLISQDGSIAAKTGVYSYEAHGDKDDALPMRLFSQNELKKRFGRLDVSFLTREVAMSTKQLEEYMRQMDLATSVSEVADIHKWRDQAHARINTLRRRIAFGYLNLPVDASDLDVSKIYKRMALELHPDKGGDPEKFQELQEMRQILLEPAPELDDDTNSSKARRRNRDHSSEDEKDDTDDEGETNLSEAAKAKPTHELERDRADAHDSTVRLWERALKARGELKGMVATGESAAETWISDPQPALNALRTFVQNFVRTEFGHLQLQPEDAVAAMGKLRKFLRKGIELIAVASALDVEGTRTTLAVHFNCILTTRCESPAIRNACEALLEALAETSRMAMTVLRSLQDDAIAATLVARVPQEVPVPRATPKSRKRRRNGADASPAPTHSTIAKPNGADTLAQNAQPANLGHLVFEPPPMRCGSYELRLRMVETHRGLEELHSSLHGADGREVAQLSGAYVLRGSGTDFHACCSKHQSEDGLSACAKLFFDKGGCLKHPLLGFVAGKALSDGLLCLRHVRLDKRLRGRDIGLDFYESVLRCLAGPMKRVTLVMSRLAAIAEDSREIAAPSPDVSQKMRLHWSRVGFRPTSGDSNAAILKDPGTWWFMEPGRNGWHRVPKKQLGQERGGAGNPRRQRHAVPSKTDTQQPPSTSHSSSKAQPKLQNQSASAPSNHAAPPKASATIKVLPPSLTGDGSTKLVAGLTPRMRYALVSAADSGALALRNDAEQFINGKPGGKYWGSLHIPAAFRDCVYKVFVRGMAEVSQVIGGLLRKRRVPSPTAILHVLSPFGGPAHELGLTIDRHAVSHFFSKGGDASHVIQAVLEEAVSFYEDREADTSEQELASYGRYHALPLHMLDGDFEFVRAVLLNSKAQAL